MSPDLAVQFCSSILFFFSFLVVFTSVFVSAPAFTCVIVVLGYRGVCYFYFRLYTYAPLLQFDCFCACKFPICPLGQCQVTGGTSYYLQIVSLQGGLFIVCSVNWGVLTCVWWDCQIVPLLSQCCSAQCPGCQFSQNPHQPLYWFCNSHSAPNTHRTIKIPVFTVLIVLTALTQPSLLTHFILIARLTDHTTLLHRGGQF